MVYGLGSISYTSNGHGPTWVSYSGLHEDSPKGKFYVQPSWSLGRPNADSSSHAEACFTCSLVRCSSSVIGHFCTPLCHGPSWKR